MKYRVFDDALIATNQKSFEAPISHKNCKLKSSLVDAILCGKFKRTTHEDKSIEKKVSLSRGRINAKK